MIRFKKISAQDLLLAIGLALSGLAVILMLTGCSMQKKLNKAAVKVANNSEATQKFFDAYTGTHDITAGKVIYLPGKETVKYSTVYDTVYLPGNSTRITERNYTDRLRVDSFFRDTKETLALMQICQDKNQTLQTLLDGKDMEIFNWKKAFDEMRASRNKWRLWFFLLLGALAALIVGKYYLKFSIPFLK